MASVETSTMTTEKRKLVIERSKAH